MQKNKKQLIFSVIFVVFILVIVVSYKTGYRITNSFTIGKVGTLKVSLPLIDTTIFIGESKKFTTTAENEVVEIKLSPKEHHLIISKKGYYPWTKKIEIPSGKDLMLNPFFIPQNPSGFIIGKIDPDYYKIKQQIVGNKLPEENKPVISTDQKTNLWVKDNKIVVKSNNKTFDVLKPDSLIKNVYFYKNRNDVVIFSTDNSIYVIEVDNTGLQNFMPVYKGQNPRFIATEGDYIYVEDSGTLMQVMI